MVAPTYNVENVYRQAMRAARVGIVANIVLVIAKFIGGILGNSTALVADAFHSLTDVISSFGLAWSFKKASEPADVDHPYGHGKVESLAATVIAGILMMVVAGILAEAWQHLQHAETSEGPRAIALMVALFSIAVKEGMFQYKMAIGRRLDSASLIAEAWHHRSDAFSSSAAALGIGGAIVGGPSWRILDPLAAILVALIMATMAVTIFRRSTLELMDTQASQETLDQIRTAAAGVPGVIEVEKLRARKSGLKILADIHIEVDDQMTVRESHRLAHEVELAVTRAVPQVDQVLVHIEPHEEAKQEGRRPLNAR